MKPIYYFLNIVCLILFVFLFPSTGFSVNDKDYINYQVELQETIFNYAQNPQAMQSRIKQINDRYQPNSDEWREYMNELSKDKEKIIELNGEVKKHLEQKGIGYGKSGN